MPIPIAHSGPEHRLPDEDQSAGAGSEAEADQDSERAADRLERALERIATMAQPVAWVPEGAARPGPTSAELARRLDAVITDLRVALEPPEANA